MAKDRYGALAFSDFDVLDRLWIAFVRRGQRSPEKIATADRQDGRKDGDGEERMKVLAAAGAASYDGLRRASSR
jgi:hypothetical protein